MCFQPPPPCLPCYVATWLAAELTLSRLWQELQQNPSPFQKTKSWGATAKNSHPSCTNSEVILTLLNLYACLKEKSEEVIIPERNPSMFSSFASFSKDDLNKMAHFKQPYAHVLFYRINFLGILHSLHGKSALVSEKWIHSGQGNPKLICEVPQDGTHTATQPRLITYHHVLHLN